MGDTYSFNNKPHYGYFTWDIASDEIWGDATFAENIGMDPATANDGFSVMRYMELVHPDDQEHVAAATRIAVLTGQPFTIINRICRGNDIVTVRARGACFRFRDGLPSMTTGTQEILQVERLRPAAANEQPSTGNSDACIAAAQQMLAHPFEPQD